MLEDIKAHVEYGTLNLGTLIGRNQGSDKPILDKLSESDR